MSAGKIVLLIFGIIVLLISLSFLMGGGALLSAHNIIKDAEGFYNTKTIQIEKDSYAVVVGPTDINVDVGWDWGWGWDLGDLITFKIEGAGYDPSTQIFLGIARGSDINSYLDDVEYDEITDLNVFPFRVDYRNHSGNVVPEAPTSKAFWNVSNYGPGTQIIEWELEPGRHSLVIMNADGSAGIDMDIVFGVKVPLLFGVSVGLLIGGGVLLAISILMIYFAARKPRISAPSAPEAPAPIEIKGEQPEVEPEVKKEIEEKTSMGLEPNVAGLLCYVLGWVSGIIIFILERDNKFVRFHALQSILVFGSLNVAGAILGWIPFLGVFFNVVIGILAFILWILLMVKAYQGEKYKIMWAGDFAEKQVS